MENEPVKLNEVLARKAEVCETIAQDKTEEALTGASHEKSMNEEEAKAWRLKAKVWLEAEAIVKETPARPAPSAS